MHPSLNEAEISSIVEAGGGRFIGVLKEAPGKSEAFVLFISLSNKINPVHSDLTVNGGGCAQTAGRIQCSLQRGQHGGRKHIARRD